MVTISGVEPGSPAARKGMRPGDKLLSVNGRAVEDVLDYRFCLTEPVLRLAVERYGKILTVTVRKPPDKDIGLLFDSYLMDEQRPCRNKCIFCFIDQLPPGLRESLYFKDDDSRLSFLFGNYITLTNLRERDIARIVEMHISPVNVSVHTTNPELRCRMMGNLFAGEALTALGRFSNAGIVINCQLVLCPGINDGAELERSMSDLAALPGVASVAAVPVGITRYREGLAALRPFTAAEASAVIMQINRMGEKLLTEKGSRIFYPSDEFFLLTGQPIPETAYYEEFAQLENGVGMTALFREQFREALATAEGEAKPDEFLLATGVAFAPFLRELVDEAAQKWHNIKVEVAPIVNRFFGEQITVAGLVTGGDLIEQLRGKKADVLLIPANMLRREGDMFLDDVTPEQVEQELGIPVRVVANDGGELVQEFMGM